MCSRKRQSSHILRLFPISLKEPEAYKVEVISSSCWLSSFLPSLQYLKLLCLCPKLLTITSSVHYHLHGLCVVIFMFVFKIVPFLPKWNGRQALENRWESLYFLILFLYRKVNIFQQNKILSFSSMRLFDLQMEIILFWTFYLELYFLPLVL